jgi:hypothetical protein
MVMCVEPGKTWCVDSSVLIEQNPFVFFPEIVFDSVEKATKAAEALKAEKAESVPCRNI